ncbi:MAG: AAA family ATPase, partial [Bacilli bacterium]|nr:AAA family ATPase [Bacilli bacterium]
GICELYREINKYTMNQIVENIALLAPTGRAAKRMSEATNIPASTIHRFLKWNKENNSFQVNEYNRCKKDFVIIDEASMIDVSLFASLLRGLSVHTRIIIVGDVDQLPSVGPGQVLFDLIESNKIHVKYLKTLYRQKEQSNIIKLAYNIREGILDTNIFNKEEDLTFIECSSDDILKKIEEISYTYLDYSYKNFQVLAPMYKTLNGIDNINNKLQTTFNKKSTKKKEILVYDEVYREGDKVIQLTNMPDENVYNGDIGIIDRIVNSTKKEIYIDFDGNIVKYSKANFINFKKAYAISIHKSQGSEFDIVIIPIVKNFQKMLYRKLIYTAVTRCKKRLYLIGDLSALNFSIRNNNSLVRRTSIKKFLIDGIN